MTYFKDYEVIKVDLEKEKYCFEKRFEKEAIESIEKMGEYLSLIDKIVDELRFYALIDKDDWILDLFHNFKIDNNYEIYRDTILFRLNEGDRIIKRKKEWINKLRILEERIENERNKK